MPRTLYNNFTSGEIDPKLDDRSDNKHYFNGAKLMRNVVALPQGGFRERWGSVYVSTVPLTGGGALSDTRLIPFRFSTIEHYLMLFHDAVVKVFKRGVQMASLAQPLASAELSDIAWTQSLDSLLVFHEDHQTILMQRQGSDVAWLISAWPYINLPQFAFGDTDYDTKIPATPSHPIGAGGTAANFNDGNPATTSTVTTIGNLTGQPDSARLLAVLDLGAVVEVSAVELIGVKLSSGGQTERIMYGATLAALVELGEDFITSTTAQNVYRYAPAGLPVSARFIVYELAAQNYTGLSVTLGDLIARGPGAGISEVQKIEFPIPTGGVWANGDTFSLSLGGEETQNIVFSTVASTMRSRIETALRNLKSTSATGISVVAYDAAGGATTATQTFIVYFGGDDGGQAWGAMSYEVKNSTEVPELRIWVDVEGVPPGEDSWSADRGWPRCGKFFQGRLWVAGSKQRPSTAWGSFAGNPVDFNNKLTEDDYGLEATPDTEDVPSMVAIFAGRHLQFFSSSTEFYVPISDEDPITPLNLVLRSTTNRGSKKGIPVFEVEGATQFLQTDKSDPPVAKTLREYIFSDAEQAYQANPISLLASHLLRDPRRIAVRRASSTEDADYVLFANAIDGSLAVFCTLRTQEVNAFTLATTAGLFKDIGVDGEDIYAIVERTIAPNAAARFHERLEFGVYLDCATVASNLGAPVAVVAGLARFNGATVGVMVDGLWRAPQAVAGGSLTLSPPAQDSYQIGLLWPIVDQATGYRWLVETLPPIYDLQDGPSVGSNAGITQIVVSVEGRQGLVVERNRFTSQRFGSTLLDQAPPLFTGKWKRKGISGHDLSRTMKIGDTLPGPGVVKAIAARVKIT